MEWNDLGAAAAAAADAAAADSAAAGVAAAAVAAVVAAVVAVAVVARRQGRPRLRMRPRLRLRLRLRRLRRRAATEAAPCESWLLSALCSARAKELSTFQPVRTLALQGGIIASRLETPSWHQDTTFVPIAKKKKGTIRSLMD